MLDDLLSEIDIEIGPVEVASPRLFNLQDGCDRSTQKPRKVLIWKKQFFVARKQPNPCAEIWLTSTPEVLVPSANDRIVVFLNDNFGLLELLTRKAVITS